MSTMPRQLMIRPLTLVTSPDAPLAVATTSCERCGHPVAAPRLFDIGLDGQLCADCAPISAPHRARPSRTRSRLRRAHIPRAWHQACIEDLDLHEQPGDRAREQVIHAAREWATGDLPGLVLSGGSGTGKSTIAGAAAATAVEHGRELRWISLPSLAQALSLPWESDGYKQGVQDLRDAEKGKHGLVLEDIDRAGTDDRISRALYLMLDAAASGNRPVLVTLSTPVAKIKSHFRDPWAYPVAGRIAQRCAAYSLNGRDRRLDTAATTPSPLIDSPARQGLFA